jgi:hypothetical protein
MFVYANNECKPNPPCVPIFKKLINVAIICPKPFPNVVVKVEVVIKCGIIIG